MDSISSREIRTNVERFVLLSFILSYVMYFRSVGIRMSNSRNATVGTESPKYFHIYCRFILMESRMPNSRNISENTSMNSISSPGDAKKVERMFLTNISFAKILSLIFYFSFVEISELLSSVAIQSCYLRK